MMRLFRYAMFMFVPSQSYKSELCKRVPLNRISGWGESEKALVFRGFLLAKHSVR